MWLTKLFYTKSTLHRYDDNGYVKYFSADDFENLHADRFTFMSGDNRLYGNYYYYDGYKENELIIFCHGIGGGHRSYMREIELLCSRGYKVLSYDNTGCFESEGKSIRCLSESLRDLDNAIKSLKSDGSFGSYDKVHVIGHSWGGYAAGNIANFHDDISSIVVISGFISVERMLLTYLKGQDTLTKKYLFWRLFKYEKITNPEYYASSSLDAINGKKSRFLLAHSTDDTSVPYESSTKVVQENSTIDSVKYLICSGRYHNPNYTEDAVNYMNSSFGEFGKKVKDKEITTLEQKKAFFAEKDFIRMTAQDSSFWDAVCEFIEG